ncbi:type I-E CRISPR-associated protein Cse2/CasB [Streptosporangium sp. NPDC023615]|uniref:type I-E CRISPR-associated protein Cse2/CasB n=1 Tax=Streptosporangium sp. NPDC023615 TaxID=3154794 RepID=UPI00343875AC
MPPLNDRPPRYWSRYIAADGTWRRKEGRPPGEDLAAMRAGLGREAGSVPALWPHYRSPVDDRLARRGQVSQEQKAEHAALALYGLHQQSRSEPMHRSGVRLGQALRRLHQSGKFTQEAVDRRVNAAAGATQVSALLTHLRGLITQLRTIGQPIDYDQLMADIYAWQRPDTRQRARRRWGLDYYRWSRPDEQKPADDGPAGSTTATTTTTTS